MMVTTESPAAEVPRPDPDRRRVLFTAPLVILGGLCALAFVLEGAMEGWSALHLEQTLDAGPAVGGLGPALYGTAAAAGRLGAQSFASRIDDRPLMTVAALLAAAGASITAIAPTAAVAIAGMFVTGAGVSVAAPTIFSLAGRIVGPEQRGRALSTVAALSYVGFLLGPPMMGAIAEASDLRWAFASVAGVALLLGALMRFAPAAPRS
jgi:predicted MFS family arabinose efflux permease